MRKHFWIAIGFAVALPGLATADAPKQEETARHQALALQAKQADAKVEQQLQLIETRLKQEEQRMTARLQQLNKMRELALKKNDQKTLKRIEQLEVQAVQEYDSRVSQIIGKPSGGQADNTATSAKPQQNAPGTGQVYARPKTPGTLGKAPVMQAPGNDVSAGKRDSSSKSKQSNYNQRQPSRSKRFKLWPF